MNEAELAELEQGNAERLRLLQVGGVQVGGLDVMRLSVQLDVLMSVSRRRVFRQRWATELAGIIDKVESAQNRAKLLHPNGAG